MRIAFFGSPPSALTSLRALIDAGHEIGLVVTQPDKPAGRGRRLTPSAVKAFALERGLPVFEPARIRKDESALSRIEAARPDINIVVAYGQIIPGPIIYLPRHRSLNVHFSLLPRHRGAAPVQWTVLAGDTETGVTIIELNERMDEGDILARASTAVGPRETAAELEARLAVLGAGLLLDALGRLGSFVREPQDHGRATLAPKLRKEDGLIDWSAEAVRVDRLVRAMAERPGTSTFLQGRRIQVHRGRPLEGLWEGRMPGEIVGTAKEGLTVACGGRTAYLVETLQPEGKAEMAAYDFSLGAKFGPGERLSNG